MLLKEGSEGIVHERLQKCSWSSRIGYREGWSSGEGQTLALSRLCPCSNSVTPPDLASPFLSLQASLSPASPSSLSHFV